MATLKGKEKEREKLKIAIFTDSYFPYLSGVVRSIEILKKELEKEGHDVFIFAPDYPTAVKKEKVFRFLSFPAPTQPGFYLPIPFSRRLPTLLKNLKIDLIHVHTPFLMGSLGLLTAKRFNLPLIFTYHTLYDNYCHYLPFGRKIVTPLIKIWNKHFCNKCEMVIAPSFFVKKILEKDGITSPIKVIPTGLPEIYFENKGDPQWLRNKFNFSKEEQILLSVGRLGKEKNIPFLLEAMELITRKKTNVRLVIVGTGPEEHNLKSLCRQKKIEQYVFFTGKIDDQDLLRCYYSADIFVFASLTETQGLVIAEAKATGLPILSLFSPPIAENIFNGEDGFLVHNLAEFVNKTLLLLENDVLRKTMGQKGKIDALRFSSHLLAHKMLAEYKKAIQIKSVSQSNP